MKIVVKKYGPVEISLLMEISPTKRSRVKEPGYYRGSLHLVKENKILDYEMDIGHGPQ